MNVNLISLTQGFISDLNGFGPITCEQLVVYIARVSNPSNQANTDTSEKLIRYLIKNKHWSPFEMVDMTVEIKTSRAIAQQILRHRSFSFQEFSQRYAEVTEFEPVQLRKQGVNNRQGGEEVFDQFETNFYREKINDSIDVLNTLYKDLIRAGVAKECARMVLPLTTQTTIYMKGSIRSWIHYLQIRTDSHTQLEHREIANAIAAIFGTEFPTIYAAIFKTEI